jgi:hypothetical protein
MGYQILQFNLGTGQAQGYVLQGTGEHEGTNENISARDMSDALSRAWELGRQQGWNLPKHEFSFLMDRPKPVIDQRVARHLAEFLDFRFLRAHGERIARDMGLPAQVDEHPQGENAEGG